MQEFIIYLIKVNLAIVLFYLIYRFLLRNNATLNTRRFYLLSSLTFAFIVPFVDFPNLVISNETPIGKAFDFQYFDNLSRIQFIPSNDTIVANNHFDVFSISFWIYLVVSILVLFIIAFNLYRIFKSIRSGKKVSSGRVCFIISEKYVSPFSFFNYIFTKSKKGLENSPELMHEMAHIKQLHSIDRLLVELLVPLLWINPFIYLFKKSLIEVHEHLADSAVIRNGYKHVDYQKYLFSQLKSGLYLKMTSNFNYSLTKKRITMISKHISKRKSMVRTLISLVLVAGIFMVYGFNNKEIIDPIVKVSKKHSNDDSSKYIPSILPLKEGGKYEIGSKFGMRKHPILGYKRMHNGIDIKAKKGTEVIAPADGIVLEARNHEGYGNKIRIQHGKKYVTVYAHLKGFNVKVGDKVKTKDVIGFVGETGLSTLPHLHYEVRKWPDVKPITYYDPADFIKNIKEIPSKSK